MVEKMFQSSFVLSPHTLRLLLRGRAVQRRLKGSKLKNQAGEQQHIHQEPHMEAHPVTSL